MQQKKNPEKHLTGKEAIEKLKEIAEKAKICMFTTAIKSDLPKTAPMTLQGVDENGNLYFISSPDSERNHEIEDDNKVQLYFMNGGSYQYLYVLGKASVSRDRKLIDEYWSDFAKAWFDDKDDPRITIVKVEPDDSYYWDTKDGKIVSFVKMSVAALTGNSSGPDSETGALEI